ncbi:hypothetical protein ALP50_102681 [Pseudomonas syringae pv. spinaceae]|uniref:Uncharacterized protein n=2 Tax=Pseudomonas syringae group TaxID=136849 RepID=A0A0Q0AVZ6_PSESX|nr:hypothetical protein ALO94_100767 [Pseudomonas syringae pv. spinaceae]RMN46392.1 hypothetical protein ALQ59_102312 [Pseudomonas syringae pv. apii]RMN57392.1 hypothetical protein ALQ58_102005 [Pseudomonas syringae pv. apii]RMN99967.1 hypothetical protein ALQ49_101695 [Pseudomonas syringae pv. apii]RMT36392.1 hypothetical protein ALP50_102681 [Pseudomonas syringae pv. spinaceae]
MVFLHCTAKNVQAVMCFPTASVEYKNSVIGNFYSVAVIYRTGHLF